MIHFRKFLPVVAVLLVGAALLGAPNQASAAYAVEVFDDNVLQGGITVIASGDSLVFLGSTTHFSITDGSGTSNNPGSAGASTLALSSNEVITTNFGANQTHTIKIELSQDGWTAPTGTPLNLTSSAGGSFAVGDTSGTDTAVTTYQGFLDDTNLLFGTPASGATTTLSAMSAGSGPLVFSPGTETNLVPSKVPFSMTDVLTFTFTIGQGGGTDTANVSATTIATAPAPGGMALAFAGLPILGIGAWWRRRQPRLTPN